MIAYVENIKKACTSIFDGMAVTFSHLFRTPMTIQYPDRTPEPVRDTLPERYRGHLVVDLEICISCRACEKACPIDCIKIEDVRIPKTQVRSPDGKVRPKVKDPIRFDINLAKCMYCGLCVDPCPTLAIHFTKEFEGSTENLADLYRRFVSDERRAQVLEKAEELKREAEKQEGTKAREETEKRGDESTREGGG